MAWIEIHQSLPNHRKTLALGDELGIEPVQAVGHMVSFWLWALDNVPSGELAGVKPSIIARAAQWTGEADRLLQAMVGVGFLDYDGEYRIHNWHRYAGKLIDRREDNKERMRAKRAQNVHNTCTTRAPATVPNSTQQNSTEHSNGSSASELAEVSAVENGNGPSESVLSEAAMKALIASDLPVMKSSDRRPDTELSATQRFYLEESGRKRLLPGERKALDAGELEYGEVIMRESIEWTILTTRNTSVQAVMTTARKKASGQPRGQPATADSWARDQYGYEVKRSSEEQN
jgi:hypothetical protein